LRKIEFDINQLRYIQNLVNNKQLSSNITESVYSNLESISRVVIDKSSWGGEGKNPMCIENNFTVRPAKDAKEVVHD
jgi:hypothetical protein